MKALIIDDDDDIRRIARLSLSKVGKMEVADLADPTRAVEVASQERPDVILLDVMMPDMDGPATLEALRGDPGTAGIPVIFLTAKSMTIEISRLLALGAAGVLTKPFDPMTLPARIKSILSGAAAE